MNDSLVKYWPAKEQWTEILRNVPSTLANLFDNPVSGAKMVGLWSAILALPLFVFSKWWKRRGTLNGIPIAPNASFLWGHERTIFNLPAGDFYLSNLRALGPTYKLKGTWFHPEILYSADPAVTHHIFQTKVYQYHKSPVIRPMVERVTGRGIVWVEGEEEHKRHRSVLRSAFTVDAVRGMEGTVLDCVEKVVTKLKDAVVTKAEDNRSGAAAVIDVMPWSAIFTLQIIGEVGFGHDFALGESKEATDLLHHSHKIINQGLEPASFIALMVIRLFPFITSLPLKELEEHSIVLRMVRKLARELAETPVEALDSGKGDILSVLLRSQEKEEKNKRLSSAEIIENLTTFIVVGHETTAAAITCTLYLLACNPHIQDKLRHEIRSYCSHTGQEQGPGFDALMSSSGSGGNTGLGAGKFPLLDAVVKESLRLFPASPYTERVAVKDDVIPLRWPIHLDHKKPINRIPVKKGQVIHVSSIAMNRYEGIWGADAAEFKPERWMSEGTTNTGAAKDIPLLHSAGPAPTNWSGFGWQGTFTFSEGRRDCIGQRLALFELKAILCALLRTFRFSLPNDERGGEDEIEWKFSNVVNPRIVGREKEGVQMPLRVEVLH